MERITRVDMRRVRLLQKGRPGGGPVLYWMQREQRAADNWPLLYGQDLAMVEKRGVLVLFCLQDEYLGAATKHFAFMLTSLGEVKKRLQKANIPLCLLRGRPEIEIPRLAADLDAHSLITDFNPLRIKQIWQRGVAADLRIPFYEVDGHNIVPCWLASNKQEYGAYTFRPKVNRLLVEFLTDFPKLTVHPYPVEHQPAVPVDLNELCNGDDCHAGGVEGPLPGEQQGQKALMEFISHRLADYDEQRNDPLQQAQSGLSPYFHFGQLAPQRVAYEVSRQSADGPAQAAFLEELIVRRELSDNFCYYCKTYDSFEGFPQWAQATLDSHRRDPREYLYTEEMFMSGATHDALWNCCQLMLRREGRLHGYLRMYWAKKILEWSTSPEEAMRIAILLNDTLAYDGRDPNGYTGIAWSIGGVHDRAWKERPVFGKIRYMNLNGCRRKFDVDGLVAATEKRLRHE